MTDPRPSPNLYEVRARQLHVTYSSSGIDGRPHFTYQDAHQTLNFKGEEIRTAETEIGLLVSVSIRRTVDTGSTTFSLMIPRVNLDTTNVAQISTYGITTIHKFSMIPAFNTGQQDLYTATPVRGTARFVVF